MRFSVSAVTVAQLFGEFLRSAARSCTGMAGGNEAQNGALRTPSWVGLPAMAIPHNTRQQKRQAGKSGVKGGLPSIPHVDSGEKKRAPVKHTHTRNTPKNSTTIAVLPFRVMWLSVPCPVAIIFARGCRTNVARQRGLRDTQML